MPLLTWQVLDLLVGYARVSTDDQNLELQRDALLEAGCERIFEDRLSGSIAERSGLREALKYARAADTLVVWRLDRLSRSLKDLIEMVALLESRDIGLKSLQESIDTSSISGKLVFHIFGALAEFERNLIRERTQAGINAARSRGRNGGRPKSLDADKRALAVALYDEKKLTAAKICEMMGISRPTLYKYINAARPHVIDQK
jgi:DNA invertase Pin-like site-specific DNA recombinase